jgi:hypothetical protein
MIYSYEDIQKSMYITYTRTHGSRFGKHAASARGLGNH